MSENCVFCKILNKEIPSYKIYEDEFTYAFLDISKDVFGHTLVIPKKHVTNILDADETTLENVIKTVKKVSKHYTQNCGFEGVNIMNANHESAGQTVFHLHFHIIPRKTGDGVDAWPKFDGSNEELQNVCEKLKMN